MCPDYLLDALSGGLVRCSCGCSSRSGVFLGHDIPFWRGDRVSRGPEMRERDYPVSRRVYISVDLLHPGLSSSQPR